MHKLFAVFTCDKWKSWVSMKLIGICNSDGLEKFINNKLIDKTFEESGCPKPDFNDLDIDKLNDFIIYGFVGNYNLNEEN